MKISNNELIQFLNAIDLYKDDDDFLVNDNTKNTLKSLLISGVDPESNNFCNKFPDEYHLWTKVNNMINMINIID